MKRKSSWLAWVFARYIISSSTHETKEEKSQTFGTIESRRILKAFFRIACCTVIINAKWQMMIDVQMIHKNKNYLQQSIELAECEQSERLIDWKVKKYWKYYWNSFTLRLWLISWDSSNQLTIDSLNIINGDSFANHCQVHCVLENAQWNSSSKCLTHFHVNDDQFWELSVATNRRIRCNAKAIIKRAETKEKDEKIVFA